MERSIVERARSGDPHAFEVIVRTRIDAVHRTAFAILGSEADAQDAVQEAFVAAWRSIGTLQDVDRFDAWFGRILTNACRMSLRRGRSRPSSTAEVPTDLADPRAPIPGADPERLGRAFARLPVEQRALLVARHLDERHIPDLAAELNVPEGTVKSRLFTARVALRRALEAER
jgi:RNA polymerase sigma-70 factor (ECF subfamily)